MSKKNKIYHCLSCGNNIPFKGYTYNHKYCNNQCQGDHRSKQADEKNLVKLLEGKLANRPMIRRLLGEIKGYRCECWLWWKQYCLLIRWYNLDRFRYNCILKLWSWYCMEWFSIYCMWYWYKYTCLQ